MRKRKLIALFISFALLLGYMPDHLIDNSLWAAMYNNKDAQYSGVIFPGDTVRQYNYETNSGVYQLTYQDGTNILYQIPDDINDPELTVLSLQEANGHATTPSAITVKLQEKAFLAWQHSSYRQDIGSGREANITRTLDALYLEPKLQNISLNKTAGVYDNGDYTLTGNEQSNASDDYVTFSLIADKGYLLPETVAVTMENNTSPEYTYDASAGTIVFKRKDIKGNVTLTASGVPILASTQVTYQGNNTIKCEGTVTNSPYVEAGFVLKDENKQEISRVSAITNPASPAAPFETQIAQLTTGSTYYVYVYLVNPAGDAPYTIQGSEQSFTVPRDFYISEASSIGTATASVEGKIDYPNYTEAGFTLMNAAGTLIKYVPCTTGKGLFNYSFTGLESNTTYQAALYYKVSAAGDPVVIETAKITFKTNASSSSGGSSGSGGSSSSGGSGTAPSAAAADDKPQTETTNASETIITVGKAGAAKVSAEKLKEIAETGKQLVITNGKTSLSFNQAALNEVLSHGTGDLNVNLAAIAAKTLEDICFNVNGQGQITALNNDSLWFNLETSTGERAALSFNEPIRLSMSLEGVQIKDISKLCLVQYRKDEQGNAVVTKLGGTYNQENKTFTAYINEAGSYGMVEAKALTQMKLKIRSNQIELNGKVTASHAAPRIIGGKTMVHLRTISEALGAEVRWDNQNKKVFVTLEGKTVTAGADEGTVNDNGYVLVGIRYIAENLDAHVLWIPSTQEVEIVR